MWIYIVKCNHRVPKPLVLVKAIGKGRTHILRVDDRSQSFDKSNKFSGGTSGSESHAHGNSSLGHKRQVPPHEQTKNDSRIKAKQKMSQAEFPLRIKTGSCINCGEQGHIFEACTKPKTS